MEKNNLSLTEQEGTQLGMVLTTEYDGAWPACTRAIAGTFSCE